MPALCSSGASPPRRSSFVALHAVKWICAHEHVFDARACPRSSGAASKHPDTGRDAAPKVDGGGGEAPWELIRAQDVGDDAVHVLVGCHALVALDDVVLGGEASRRHTRVFKSGAQSPVPYHAGARTRAHSHISNKDDRLPRMHGRAEGFYID